MYLEDVFLVLLAQSVLGSPWPEGVHPLRHGEGVATGGVADVEGVLPHRLQGLGQHDVGRLPLVVPGALVAGTGSWRRPPPQSPDCTPSPQRPGPGDPAAPR